MHLYIVRHGQTGWNMDGKFQGSVDNFLNSNGINQAKKLAIMLKNCKLDFIYSSPLCRAYDTAKIINNFQKVPILLDNRLVERSLGTLEGKYYTDFTNSSLFSDIWNYSIPNYQIYSIETLSSLTNRAYNFLNDLLTKFEDTDANILIVAHGSMNKCLLKLLNEQELAEKPIDNCNIIHLENPTLNKQKK